ncbi:phage tail protein [Caldicoprobacter algeriensis]|uniref:phage tail spike protein n=1 Tax=Caldicoprobacter algeriensis TaxID=699281 RepID=UPI002079C952|nr:phage tail spike protein [Caldicoprobacter algeriensis]MCM8900623.1 phage tail protein [Caldicoprobacter algeriensis]
MYAVYIYNYGVETCIHYPTADKDMPHLLRLSYKEALNQANVITFTIPANNPGYGQIAELTTKVKVVNVRPDSYFLTESMVLEESPVLFSGRVLNIVDSMDENGMFVKEVTCEGALNYLNDIHVRRISYINKTPAEILGDLLARYNASSSNPIQLGTVELTQPITVDYNYETVLNCIIKLRNILGGDIRVRDDGTALYLDYLKAQGENNNVEIRIGYNTKSYIREYDPTEIVTRLIGLGYGEGINQLTFASINNGKDYIEDAEAIAKYGVIEGIMVDKDIQNAYTLLQKTQTVLNEKKQPKLTISCKALDLSVLTGHEGEKFSLGDTLHIINDRMPTSYYLTENFIAEETALDVYARVVERSFNDLLSEPFNPDIVISTRPVRLSDEIIDLKQRNATLENAPQGSTYIDTYGYAENIDAEHPFQLPVWLSPDILNVNRVRLHIDSQKYRAYEKGAAAGGGTSVTSEAGGGTTVTSSAGGGTTATSSSGGGTTVTSSSAASHRHKMFNNIETSAPASDFINAYGFTYSREPSQLSPAEVYLLMLSSPGGNHLYTYEASGEHSHSVTIPNHSHTVTVPDHSHTVTIPNHSHAVTIPDHAHVLQYGIFEDTYPQNVYVKVNGQTVAGPLGADGNPFSVDIDLTPYIAMPGQTYIIEITSSRNGRINAWVSIQAFIQAK